MTYQWDRRHSNRDELAAQETNGDQIEEAIRFHKAGDFAAAFQKWLALAQKGSVWSMFEVGQCYETGAGVTADQEKAETWYKRACAGGSQLAMLACARLAASRHDYAACENILQPGVEQGWAPAKFWLAWYRHEQSESMQICRRLLPLLNDAAAKGHPGAKFLLANFTIHGKFGLLRVPFGFLLALRNGLEASRQE